MKLNRKKLAIVNQGEFINKKTAFDIYLRTPTRLRSIRRGLSNWQEAMLWANTFKKNHPNTDVIVIRKHSEALVVYQG